MKILYVTGLFSGIKPLIVNCEKIPKGNPAFLNPFKKMIDIGWEIDIVAPLYDEKKDICIEYEYFKGSKVFLFEHSKKLYKRFFKDIMFIYFIYKILKKGDYDFVYNHGTNSIYGTIASNLINIPNGARIYGSFLHYKIKKYGKLYCFFRFYKQYLPFLMNKYFIIMTNDGTKGDLLKEKIAKNKNYSFYFLLNGAKIKQTINNNYKNILLYPGRIEKWKNQKFAIELLHYLDKKRENDFKLFFAGRIYNESYWNEINELIRKYQLVERVKYLGVLPIKDLNSYYENCFSVLSFYEYSNLGNVAIEAITRGGLLISRDDSSLNGIIKNNENGILINTAEEAADQIIKLKNDNQLYTSLKKNSLNNAKNIFSDWHERSIKEIDIIKNFA